jgi:iron complex outermembrane receptor protein
MQNYSFIARRLIEAGQRTFDQKVNTYSLTTTLDGNFSMLDHDWYWDVNGLYGLNKANQSFTGNVRADRVALAIGPLAACNATPGCVPLNLFGGAGSITPQCSSGLVLPSMTGKRGFTPYCQHQWRSG